MFGVEEKKVTLPYVETANVKFGEVTAFPKWKYHEKYPTGIVVNNETEEEMLGDGWVDSPGELGIETCPAYDKADPVAERLALLRQAVAETK